MAPDNSFGAKMRASLVRIQCARLAAQSHSAAETPSAADDPVVDAPTTPSATLIAPPAAPSVMRTRSSVTGLAAPTAPSTPFHSISLTAAELENAMRGTIHPCWLAEPEVFSI